MIRACLRCVRAPWTVDWRLDAPRLDDFGVVTGANKEKHRKENKTKQKEKQAAQGPIHYWTHHEGQFARPLPTPNSGPRKVKGSMCPKGLALHHAAADHLL